MNYLVSGTTYELVIQSIPGTTLKTYDGQAAITQEITEIVAGADGANG